MAALFDRLTPREREIVEAVVRGLDKDDIAAMLFLSPFTVKTHINRSMTKVGARNGASRSPFRPGSCPDVRWRRASTLYIL